MTKYTILIIGIFYSSVIWGQTLSSTVIAVAGDSYTNTSASLSITIGEPIAEAYLSSSILCTGFQQSDHTKQLLLNLYPEGLWNGYGLNKAQGSSGDQFPGNTADKINVELHAQSPYSSIIYTVSGVNLATTGQAIVAIPEIKAGTYYVTIKHRNSIETVSAVPVSFLGGTISYNFTDQASKAYGNNQKLLFPGVYGIYTGDINGDGIVNASDLNSIYNDASAFIKGYVGTDLNADGIIDALDLIPADNNAAKFVSVKKP